MAAVDLRENSLAYTKFMDRSFLLFSFLVYVLISGYGPSYAADPTFWGDLSSWIGRYPTDQEGKSTRHLLEQPEIRKTLQSIVPSDRLRQLRSFTEEKPITAVDRFLLVQMCKPHDCPNHQAMVALDRNEERMWVGLFVRGNKAVSTCWFGTDDPALLPIEVTRAFVAAHRP